MEITQTSNSVIPLTPTESEQSKLSAPVDSSTRKLPNPTGKNQYANGVSTISQALKLRIRGRTVSEIADSLIDLAKNSDSERIRLLATDMIADRTEGKPMQSIQVQHSMSETTAQRITALADRMFGGITIPAEEVAEHCIEAECVDIPVDEPKGTGYDILDPGGITPATPR